MSVSLAVRAPEVRAGLDDEIPPFAGEGVERRLVVLVLVKTAELRQEMTLGLGREPSSAVNSASTMACQVMAAVASMRELEHEKDPRTRGTRAREETAI